MINEFGESIVRAIERAEQKIDENTSVFGKDEIEA